MTLSRTELPLEDGTIRLIASALKLDLYRNAPLPDGIAAIDLRHETQRLTCSALRTADGMGLPDIHMENGTGRWTDYAALLPDGTASERLEAHLRRHAELAAAVLSAPAIDEEIESRRLNQLCALAATCDAPPDENWMMTAVAPTPWSALSVRGPIDEFPPDPSFARLMPQTVSTKLRNRTGSPPTINIGLFVAMPRRADMPDPMEAMRILSEMRSGEAS